MIREQDHRCALTGIKFDESARKDGGRVRPYVASVDRVDARGPYSRDNCRVVCAAMNAALGDWGEDVFERLMKGYCKRQDWFLATCTRKPRAVAAEPVTEG
jgi:hypothetical protein